MDYAQKLRQYIVQNKIRAEQLIFQQSTHSVAEAANAANADEKEFVKNICMIDSKGDLIVAIVKGEDRASTRRVAQALNIERPRIANPDEILEKSGYPCGGTPSFGFNAIFIIDPKVMEMEIVFTGGGSTNSLVKISPLDMQSANSAKIVRIRK